MASARPTGPASTRRSAATSVPSLTSRPWPVRRESSTAYDALVTRTATRRNRWGPRRPRRRSRSPARCSTPPSPEASRRNPAVRNSPQEAPPGPIFADDGQRSRGCVFAGEARFSAPTHDGGERPNPLLGPPQGVIAGPALRLGRRAKASTTDSRRQGAGLDQMREFGGEALGIDLAVRHHGDVAPRRPRHPHPGENPRTVTDARHLETRYFPLDLGLLERAGHGGEEESGGGHDHDVGEVTRDAGEYQEHFLLRAEETGNIATKSGALEQLVTVEGTCVRSSGTTGGHRPSLSQTSEIGRAHV